MAIVYHFKSEMAHLLKWFTDSPDAGDPACICSYCGEVIGNAEDDENSEIPLRIWGETSNTEMRLHMRCARIVVVELSEPVAMKKAPEKKVSNYQDEPSYAEGKAAFAEGVRRGANPYASGQRRACYAWWAGWDAAWDEAHGYAAEPPESIQNGGL